MVARLAEKYTPLPAGAVPGAGGRGRFLVVPVRHLRQRTRSVGTKGPSVDRGGAAGAGPVGQHDGTKRGGAVVVQGARTPDRAIQKRVRLSRFDYS